MADNTNRRAGTIFIKKDGNILELAGDWDFNPGGKKRSTKKGPTQRLGYKEEVQDCYLEGNLADNSNLDIVKDLYDVTNSSITLELANGKTWIFKNAWWAADGKQNTGEGEIEARFEAISATEVK